MTRAIYPRDHALGRTAPIQLARHALLTFAAR